MKHLTLLLLLTHAIISVAQDEPPIIWTNGDYLQTTSDQVVSHTKNLSVLIVDCNSDTKGLFASLKNNPQLTEVQLTHVNQALLNAIFQLDKPSITALIIDDFQGKSCHIPVCNIATLTQLHLLSNVTRTLEFAPNAFQQLEILNIEMNELTEWKGPFSNLTVGLIDVTCLKLEKLPVMDTPQLYQYSISTSAPFPTDICGMEELTLVYISTTTDSQLPACYEEFMQRDGLIEFVTFSLDDTKRTSIKSAATIDFERAMQEDAQRALEEMQKD